MIKSITNSWIPKSVSSEYSIFLEDDVEVSPYYHTYAVYCVLNYLIPTPSNRKIIGCSLYTPRINELYSSNPENPDSFNSQDLVNEDPLFLFQMPCSWGSVMTGDSWDRFLKYYQLRKLIAEKESIEDELEEIERKK